MSDTILGGDFTIYYVAENRQKRIVWTGSATGTRTVNELYSALQDQFDELLQMDDGTPMSAQTPTEYTIGIIDPLDTDPWFIDRSSIEHLTRGAIKTNKWKRTVSTDTGIVKMGYAETVALVAGDIGKTIVMTTDGDTGTLLDFNASTLELWIRPATSAAGNSFDNSPTANGAWTITSGTGTGTQAGGAAVTGESLWAGIFTLATGVDDLARTHFYVSQKSLTYVDALLTTYKPTSPISDWWSDGSIDILINIKEVDVVKDGGFLTVFSRMSTKTYDATTVDVSAGGRNPVPLSTADDLQNTVGDRVFTGSSGTGTFVVGETISKSGTNKKAILTAVGGTGAAPVLTYYLIGDPIVDFVNGDTSVTGATSTATCTAGTPADTGPALDTGITVTFAPQTTFDIDEDGVTEKYSILIDANNLSLSRVYQRLMYLTRRASTTALDGIDGRFYIGTEQEFVYTSLTGTINSGDLVTQVSSGAKGVVIAHNTTDKIVTLRSVRGTFVTNQNVEKDGSNRFNQPLSSLLSVTAKKATPFGDFPGGSKFFGAFGVVLSNVPSADANNYSLTTDDNLVKAVPAKVTLAITNTRKFDRLAAFRLVSAGGDIKKTEFTISGTPAANSTSLVVTTSIPADVPGKATGGVLFVKQGITEDRYRYTSWSSSTFTLFTTTQAAADAGSTQTSLQRAGATFITDGVKKGDIVFDVTEATYAYVAVVVSETELTTTNVGSNLPVTSWSGDTFHIGATVRAYTGSDNLYVPLIHIEEDTGTEGSPGEASVLITYVADIPISVVARQGKIILPFTTSSTVKTTGASVGVVRNPDTIAV